MKVKLRFFGMLAHTYGPELDFNLMEGITWGEAINTIFERFNLGQIRHSKGTSVSAPGYLLLFLNGREQPPETTVRDGDEVLVSQPLVGG